MKSKNAKKVSEKQKINPISTFYALLSEEKMELQGAKCGREKYGGAAGESERERRERES